MSSFPHPVPGPGPAVPHEPAGNRVLVMPRVARAGIFPPLAELLDLRGPYLVPLLLLVATRSILGFLLPLAAEDAYITYRYSRNLALGLGPVFNPGERVMGFTSPLWMLWNALGWMLTRDPVTWSRATSLAGDAVTLVVGGALLARHASRASAWCFTFAFATWTACTGIAISGMENSMMITLLVLSAALAESRSAAAGPVLGALALIRPEGLVAAAVLALGARWRERVVALAIVAVGVAALALTFGSPLPQSVTAKAAIYGTPGPWAGRHWWEWVLPMSLGRWPLMPDTRFLFLGTVLAAPAAFEGLRRLWGLRDTGLARAVAALLVVWIAYALSGATYFFWYMAVPLAAWFLMVAVGLPHIVRGSLVYVSAALLLLGAWTTVWELYAGRARAEQTFVEVADHLVRNSSPWQKVLLEPIGIVGYRAKVVVLDEVGLVSPRIARRRLEGPGWMTDVIAAERPEWLVVRRGVLTGMEAFAGVGAPFRGAPERDAILARYEVSKIVGDPAGPAALVILRRRSTA